jgi:sigma-B regulation protein RsbU (phosphoserine phosphatase)
LLIRGGALSDLPATGVPIAALPDFPYAAESVDLSPGDLLAVFSDGIPEAARGDDFFEDARLAKALLEQANEARLDQIAGHVIGRVDEFLAGSGRTDDVTLVLLRRDASA